MAARSTVSAKPLAPYASGGVAAVAQTVVVFGVVGWVPARATPAAQIGSDPPSERRLLSSAAYVRNARAV